MRSTGNAGASLPNLTYLAGTHNDTLGPTVASASGPTVASASEPYLAGDCRVRKPILDYLPFGFEQV